MTSLCRQTLVSKRVPVLTPLVVSQWYNSYRLSEEWLSVISYQVQEAFAKRKPLNRKLIIERIFREKNPNR